jgi:hypothetical protein
VAEELRYSLYERLSEVLGRQEAGTLMEHLPPGGWADVATKQDVEALGLRLQAEFHKELRAQLFAMLAAMGAMSGLVLAAARGIH